MKAAAIVQPAGEDAEPIVLLNPTIIEAADDSDEQYEVDQPIPVDEYRGTGTTWKHG